MSTSTVSVLSDALLDAALQDQLPDDRDALTLASETDTRKLAAVAAQLRDRGFGNLVTYSRKVFIPLTHLCRDVCHYCTFAQTPKHIGAPYMPIDQVLEVARQGKALGCKEALFTLGEKPELRYKAAREALAKMGYRDYARLPARRCQGRARRDRPAAAPEPRHDDRRRTRAAAAGVAVDGHHAGVGVRPALRKRHAALRFARQESGRAPATRCGAPARRACRSRPAF